MEQIKLWTIQPIEIMDIIKTEGKFICNKEKSSFGKDFKRPYTWMIKQMDKKGILHPENLDLPIWAWYKRNWKQKKPDLREGGYDTRGTKCVCIELIKPIDEVLLSDFETWHYVLNNMYLDTSENEKEWDEQHNWFDSLESSLQIEEKEKSWNRIFDLTPFENEWKRTGCDIQATFWELKEEDIQDIRYFIAK